MRIGVNTRLLLPGTLEGIGRFTHEVISRMVEEHPEDDFFFFFDRPFDKKYVYFNNVTPVVLSPNSRHPILWYWWFEKSVSKAIIEYKIDVFFSPELYCCLSVDTPTLMIAHDLAFAHYPNHIPFSHRNYLKYFVPRFLQRADKIGGVSRATIKDLKENYAVENEKVFLSYNGPTPGFRPLKSDEKKAVRNDITEGSPYFIYLGSMHPRKNLDTLIKAYGVFRDKHPELSHKLVLVGRLAWKSKKIKEAYETSAYKSDILPLGQRKDANRLVGAATAMVYISLFEGFGIPLLEAMQCKVPVITSKVSSMPEVAGKAGLLVDPENLNEIAEAMFTVTNDYIRDNLIQEGNLQVEHFSWDKTAVVVYDQLRTLVNA
jgi:glycosyltransferase involved in cell wall biosynthesis